MLNQLVSVYTLFSSQIFDTLNWMYQILQSKVQKEKRGSKSDVRLLLRMQSMFASCVLCHRKSTIFWSCFSLLICLVRSFTKRLTLNICNCIHSLNSQFLIYTKLSQLCTILFRQTICTAACYHLKTFV